MPVDANMPLIRCWVVLVTGFRQDFDMPTGLEPLWLRLRRLSSPTVCVQIVQWDEDMGALASFMGRLSTPGVQVCLVTYSYGTGVGGLNLATALGRLPHPMPVRLWASADGVYRSRIFPTWLPLNPLSLVRGPRIEVPANVHEVLWTRQRVNRPAGHELVAADARLHGACQGKLRQVEINVFKLTSIFLFLYAITFFI